MNLPNKITMSRICLIPVFAVIFLLDVIPYNYFIACAVFVVAACTDFIDGHIARSRGLVTTLGKFLDPIADKVLVSTALILLLVRPETLTAAWQGAWVMPVAGVCVAIILARELIVSGLRMVAASAGLVLAADNIGKVKTTVQDISVALLVACADIASLHAQAGAWICGIGYAALVLATLLTVWSGINYIVKNRAVFSQK